MRKGLTVIVFIILILSLAGCGGTEEPPTNFLLDDLNIGVTNSYDVPAGVYSLVYSINNESRLRTEIGLGVEFSVKDEQNNDVPVHGNGSITVVAGKTYTVTVTAQTTLGSKQAVYVITAIDGEGNQNNDAVLSIKVKSGTMKQVYSLQENLSLNGALLEVTYESGAKKEFAIKQEWVSNFNTATVRTNLMGITYGGKSCSFEYSVINEFSANGLSFKLSSNNTFEIISGEPDNSGNVVIPKTYDNKPVTAIADRAFENARQLKTVSFAQPSNIAEIGVRAFAGCVLLEEILLPTSVLRLEEAAFFGCDALGNATFGAITELPDEAFKDCRLLTSVALPPSVTTIGARAFAGCNALRTVVFGEHSQLSSIKSEAFSGAVALNIFMLTSNVPPQTATGVFSGITALSILVPDEETDTYKQSQYWSAHSAAIRSSTVEVVFYADDIELYTGRVVYGNDLTDVPPLPEKTGYVPRWNRENFIKISQLESRVDALFSPIDITVVFRTEGGDIERRLKFGASITDIPPVPTRDGYDGIWDVVDFGKVEQTDLIVQPVYTPIVYVITFVTGGEPLEEMSVSFGSELSLPGGVKTGNSFHGWYTGETLSQLFSQQTMPARDLTLWAKFLPNNYTLSFETNGGLKHSPLLQQFNTLIDAVPSKEGHTFLNWYDNAELSGEPVTRVPATDTLLYAKWALSDY
ncbi:MAG: leucine-rich repeat protein, partial [Clostridia bacterium]|nr:leucine-rich repeat protein [Clostridia bacterium]